MQSFGNGCGFKYQLTRLNTPGMSTTHRAHFICKVIAFVWSLSPGKMKVKKKQKEEDDDDANDDDNDDDNDDGGGGDGDDDVYRLTVIDVRKKGLLVSFWKTTHIHPIWAPGDLESAAPPACQGSCMQKLPPLLLHQKKREKEGARGLGIELLESKKDKKDEINRIREKKKTKKGILPPSPPPASPSSSPTFIPCTVLLSRFVHFEPSDSPSDGSRFFVSR